MITKTIAPTIHHIGRAALVVVLGLAAIVNAKAEEGSYAQRIACTPDAWRLCGSEIPDVDAVKACMKANKAKLSAGCRATFNSEHASR